jgi:hypothetical protein
MIRKLTTMAVLLALLASVQAADQVVTHAGDNGAPSSTTTGIAVVEIYALN